MLPPVAKGWSVANVRTLEAALCDSGIDTGSPGCSLRALRELSIARRELKYTDWNEINQETIYRAAPYSFTLWYYDIDRQEDEVVRHGCILRV